jgi:cytochrome c oxidase cbb3-type subunit 3
MTGFWSLWTIFFIVITLAPIVFLFLWGLRVEIRRNPTGPAGTCGRTACCARACAGFRRGGSCSRPCGSWPGIGYLTLYPGFGAFAGALGWTSHDELAKAQAANRDLTAPLRVRILGKSVESIAADAGALRAGGALFIENCAACHGRDARGNAAIGAPDLTDGDWLHGGDGRAILASIRDGRRGAMPPFAAQMPDESIVDVSHFVASLSGMPHDSLRAAIGKPLFVACAACHGAEGKGNPALGAPNLTDSVWLYAGSGARGIAETIRRGRTGEMPAWRDRLSEDQMVVLAAWVYAQSRPAAIATK